MSFDDDGDGGASLLLAIVLLLVVACYSTTMCLWSSSRKIGAPRWLMALVGGVTSSKIGTGANICTQFWKS